MVTIGVLCLYWLRPCCRSILIQAVRTASLYKPITYTILPLSLLSSLFLVDVPWNRLSQMSYGYSTNTSGLSRYMVIHAFCGQYDRATPLFGGNGQR